VIVEVVARDVGESTRREAHSVEPVLGKAVAGGFAGQMRRTAFSEIGKPCMERNRIGRRVDQRLGLAAKHDAGGA
jgi:hypothetical protein